MFEQLSAFFKLVTESKIELSLFLNVMREFEMEGVFSREVVVFEDVDVSVDRELSFFEVEFFEGESDLLNLSAVVELLLLVDGLADVVPGRAEDF